MKMVRRQTSVNDMDPKSVAVVLIDFQNDFCHQEAHAIDNKVSNREASARANKFAAAAASLGANVVYTKQVLDPDFLSERQREWAINENLCLKDSWGSELFLKPIPVSTVVTKYRYDLWQSKDFLRFIDTKRPEGFVFAGIELRCCVLFAVLGADERGFRFSVPMDLVSGIDSGKETDNRYVREYLKLVYNAPDSAEEILKAWQTT